MSTPEEKTAPEAAPRPYPETPAECTPPSQKKYLESRFCILRGILLLLGGSLLLLTCKMPLPDFFMEILAFLGGVAILFGNGYILFGLLIQADSRDG